MKLTCDDIYFNYGSIKALDGVSLNIGHGEMVSLVGPNGSGKTTLLKCFNKLLKPKKGVILVEGRDLSEFGLREIARLAGYVPQGADHMFPSTVFDAVLLGRRPYVGWSISSKDKEIVSQIVAAMGLESLALRHFNELSGSEKQKVLVARALAQEPEILLLDEPTSSLDLRRQIEILDLIAAIVKEKRIHAIMAIHDLNWASRFSDKIIILKKGRIYAVGDPSEVLTAQNIKEVYGVDAIVNYDAKRPHIIPIGVSD